jgi:ribonucleoside-diphosphate reductase alpha chain
VNLRGPGLANGAAGGAAVPASATNGNGHGNGNGNGHAPSANGGSKRSAAATAVMPKSMKAEQARLKGYEGDPCPECQQFTLVRNGTCLKCDSCGSTTGCS